MLSTLHTNDAPSAVTRLLELGVAPYLLNATLNGIMAQRLVRTLCPHCKEKVDLHRDEDQSAWEALVAPWRAVGIDKVAGIEARGFILGGAVAHGLKAGFVPIRKRGKLPHETVRVAYSLEYGVDEMEMHRDAIRSGEKVLLIDDLVATGGTAAAAAKLLKEAGADMVAASFVIDLPDLGGATRLRDAGIEVQALLTF